MICHKSLPKKPKGAKFGPLKLLVFLSASFYHKSLGRQTSKHRYGSVRRNELPCARTRSKAPAASPCLKRAEPCEIPMEEPQKAPEGICWGGGEGGEQNGVGGTLGGVPAKTLSKVFWVQAPNLSTKTRGKNIQTTQMASKWASRFTDAACCLLNYQGIPLSFAPLWQRVPLTGLKNITPNMFPS